mmetsp:Transcript_37890/g.46145  ORF Transcript_37890/g.46145 Transcript_37890/m.46145 type:complete len:101 (-) Transcript_37890:77-379(-)
MMLVCASVSMAASFALMQETKAVGGHMFDMATYRETYHTLKHYANKLVMRSADSLQKDPSNSSFKDHHHGASSSSDSDSPEKGKQAGGKRMHLGSAVDEI